MRQFALRDFAGFLHDHGRSKDPKIIAKRAEVFEPIRKRLLSEPRQAIGPIPDLTVITWNNKREKGPLEQSLDHWGVPCLVLGQEVREWSHALKPKLIVEIAPKVKTKYLLALDSADVLAIGDPRLALERFQKNFSCRALFQGSLLAWPKRNMTTHIKPEVVDAVEMHEEKFKKTRHFRLNSGCLIAEAKFYFQLAEEALAHDSIDNQMIFRDLYRRHYPAVQIDQYCQIFQSLWRQPLTLNGNTLYVRRFNGLPLFADRAVSAAMRRMSGPPS